RLQRRFSPALVRLGADGVEPLPGGGASGTLGLVGRELCLYLPIDASQVPLRQREGYVAMAVRRAAPFPDPEHDVLWIQGHAAVGYGSRERIRSRGGGAGRHRAEAMFRGAVHREDAVEVLRLDAAATPEGPRDAGVEARVWRNGRLQASRWWAQPPDPA